MGEDKIFDINRIKGSGLEYFSRKPPQQLYQPLPFETIFSDNIAFEPQITDEVLEKLGINTQSLIFTMLKDSENRGLKDVISFFGLDNDENFLSDVPQENRLPWNRYDARHFDPRNEEFRDDMFVTVFDISNVSDINTYRRNILKAFNESLLKKSYEVLGSYTFDGVEIGSHLRYNGLFCRK